MEYCKNYSHSLIFTISCLVAITATYHYIDNLTLHAFLIIFIIHVFVFLVSLFESNYFILNSDTLIIKNPIKVWFYKEVRLEDITKLEIHHQKTFILKIYTKTTSSKWPTRGSKEELNKLYNELYSKGIKVDFYVKNLWDKAL